jgi:hypothetical protein
VCEFVRLFGGEHVSLDADGQIEVEPGEPNEAIPKALNVVERWLEGTRIRSAKVWVDNRADLLERPQRLQAKRWPRRQIARSA